MDDRALQQKANEIRLEALTMIYEGGDGHPGPALSAADILTALYFDILRIDPARPDWADRDRLILSKGHACPALYAALKARGYVKGETLPLRALGSIWQGHPVLGKTPGVDFTSGSLGNGIAVGAGMALAGRLQGRTYGVYVIVGDGELQEGVIWEGVHLAAAQGLSCLTVFVDTNGWQSGGAVETLMGANDPAAQFAACRWHVQEIDGHDIHQIRQAALAAANEKTRPSAIICHTVKGKGVPFMENDNTWHKGVPTREQMAAATAALGGTRR